jgi:molybdenum cofactor cytidylyltransferase
MAQAHAIQTTEITSAQIGWVLTHDVSAQDGSLLVSKGAILDSSALERLAGAAPGELHLVELSATDLHEDEGGRRVAAAVSGGGVGIAGPMQSRYDLVAEARGVVRVDAGLLRAINHVEGVTVYTMLDWQPVMAGTVVASVKISPIAIAASQIDTIERLCQQAGVPALEILPFQPKRVAVLTTEPLDTEQRARFQVAIERKLAWYGASLADLRVIDPSVDAVANAFGAFLHDGCEIVLAGGGNPIDPLDPIDQALPLVGARIVHRGAPTRGSMFWLAEAGDVPIVNVASVRMLSGTTAADAFLPMLMAGHRVTRDDILDIGVGGLPGSAIRFRFPPYDAEGER